MSCHLILNWFTQKLKSKFIFNCLIVGSRSKSNENVYIRYVIDNNEMIQTDFSTAEYTV
jgi:hypothetical protein